MKLHPQRFNLFLPESNEGEQLTLYLNVPLSVEVRVGEMFADTVTPPLPPLTQEPIFSDSIFLSANIQTPESVVRQLLAEALEGQRFTVGKREFDVVLEKIEHNGEFYLIEGELKFRRLDKNGKPTTRPHNAAKFQLLGRPEFDEKKQEIGAADLKISLQSRHLFFRAAQLARKRLARMAEARARVSIPETKAKLDEMLNEALRGAGLPKGVRLELTIDGIDLRPYATDSGDLLFRLSARGRGMFAVD